MMKANIHKPSKAALVEYQRFVLRWAERAALVATDRASASAKSGIRQDMAGARLGRLGFAIGSGSDLRKNQRVHRRAGNGFRASGWVFVRSKSERTLGAIEAYTQGATIRGKKSRWLWIATDEIPARAGRYRMTPERYIDSGLDKKIGPLEVIRSVNGRPLLVIKNAGVNAGGLPHRAKNLRKNGQPRKGQRLKEFIVAFVGIPATSRTRRIDVRARMREEQGKLGRYFREALGQV